MNEAININRYCPKEIASKSLKRAKEIRNFRELVIEQVCPKGTFIGECSVCSTEVISERIEKKTVFKRQCDCI